MSVYDGTSRAGRVEPAGAGFLVMCQAAGVDPHSIPDAPDGQRRSTGHPAARRFKPRHHPRSPDRKASRERRRILGGSNDMPPNIRKDYTEGERAVLTIIAGEVKHHGVCDLPIDQIAALAGVCRSTVQNTLHKAREDHHHIKVTARPRPGRKNLPNLIEIISLEWRAWLKRGPTAHRPIGSKMPKMVSPTKNTEVSSCAVAAAAASQGAWRGEQAARLRPAFRR
ncbi:MAG: hypothetical protein HC900_07535 [Methylacidiphilales bacterium]|nr:hypothetical protein [Candidatus Methylacidiphilales bacterium]